MCESHTIYHLCGHVKVKTLVQCAEMIEKLIASKMQVTCSHQLCADVSDNIHIFPDICVKCEENGVIGEFLNQDPSRKLEILRDWKKQNKLDHESKSTLGASAEKPSATATDSDSNDDVDKLETLEVLTVADITSSLTTETESERLPSSTSPETVASSVTSVGGSSDLKAIKTRVTALRDCTERLLSKIRAQKSVQ
ncbi:hypothetical protein EDD37DRAFT_109599 [Exophiala viscosa]|uniref:uncharacterized protein n=1 Tax=Exophiala viscosa TaxID=2486360 RepID=UPI002191E48D|nr:hypothetical protein EDD37DRAFT_109599 [Exophiala viscosa]